MKFIVSKSQFSGTVEIPGSKSHTIRALFFATLAEGTSRVIKPLESQDALSAVKACKMLGAKIEEDEEGYTITGTGGKPVIPDDIIDVGNSGTTLRIALSTAALVDGYTVFTGDHQIRSRPVAPVLEALNNLGARAFATKNNGKAPVVIGGKAKGGVTELDGLSSQFLTSLLINAPLFQGDTTIQMTRLNEVPYVDMTLWWLDKFGISYTNDNYKTFTLKGGQSYKAFNEVIPGDFSSATFFIVLAAISGGTITLKNLDITDPQGDKLVVSLVEKMGARVTIKENKDIVVEGQSLAGMEIDMNSIPDALPALSVLGCFAEGETKLLNVEQARYKETDRIAVMKAELGKMGARIEELKDGLIIKKSTLSPAEVKGHHDHRIVMSLALAGLQLEGETIIDTAEAAQITFPTFPDLIASCGGNIRKIED